MTDISNTRDFEIIALIYNTFYNVPILFSKGTNYFIWKNQDLNWY